MVTLAHPTTKTTHNKPQEVIDIVTTLYTKEQQRATPDHLPKAPWTQPQIPDNFDITPPFHNTIPHPETTLDTYITRSHYDMVTTRAPEGKAPRSDAITNELIKHLPEAKHTLIYKRL